ncbi:MAG: type IV toxin-antitoxin system AbiEi family antitoxin domain-containing protein [Thermomicrobiales bacterium]
MGDVTIYRPDHTCLFAAASEQHGYFTAAQARACGFTRFLLAKHAETGRFIRIRRGLYRLRDYPSSPREEVVAAWLAVGKDVAVVSHESALDLLELSNVIPNRIHLTVPRSKRHLPDLPGVAIHTTTRPLNPLDVAVRDGIRLTSPTRTILDAAEAGTAPNQIEMAIRQAVEQGLATRRQLEQGARERSKRVNQLVVGALHQGAQ